jgi:crotonobetainyl-CoA:carnitine CoA-transferase CaiB-like acyl-CoA transferase
MSGDAAALPLAGIRVVEFVHMVMGPTCGLVLADLGADVIKVEPAPRGDNTRRLVGSGAGFFATFNRNKRSIALDLRTEKGQEIARRLIATADVVTENFRPGAMAELGLDYESLKAAHPRLVYCSMKGFLPGPYEHRTALDEVVQMMGGLAYMTGPPGRPLRAGSSVNDIMGGVFGAVGVLAALRRRDATGRGGEVTASLFETNVLLMAQHMAQYAVTGKPAAPMPQRLSVWAVYDVFDTKDGDQVFIGVVTDTQWRRFCESFGLADYAADPELQTNPQRVAARERIMPRLAELFGGYTKAELMAKLEAASLPYAPITRPEELFDDPHLAASGGLVETLLPDGRKTRLPALPLALDGARFGRRRDLPRLGEHARELLEEVGYDAGEIDRLIAERVAAED